MVDWLDLWWVRTLLGLGAVVALFVLVIGVRVRIRWRGARLQRLALRNGLRWVGPQSVTPLSWRDLACFSITRHGRFENCVDGERHGRAFTLLDFHYEAPTLADRESYLYQTDLVGRNPDTDTLMLVDHARDPGFSAVVIECRIPHGTPTAHTKRGLAPWRAEFGAEASVLRLDDGYCSPQQFLDAVARLNTALDRILTDAAHAAA